MLLKGGRPSTAVAQSRDREDSWILHASAEFSRFHRNTAPEQVAEILVEHFVGLLNMDYEMDVIDSHACLWEEGWFSDFGPYVSDELLEARASGANFMKALDNGGWGTFALHVSISSLWPVLADVGSFALSSDRDHGMCPQESVLLARPSCEFRTSLLDGTRH